MKTLEVPAAVAAWDVLHEYWVGEDGKAAFPVDTVRIASAMGAAVAVADLPHPQRGIAVRNEPGATLQFLLRSSDNEGRRRRACARLIALTHNRLNSDEPVGFIDNEDPRRRTPYMDEFASELLMPGSVVRAWWGEAHSVTKMAKRFGVTHTEMLDRLINLRLVG